MRNTFRLWPLAIFVSACAGHAFMNGSVVMVVAPNEAHVCLTDAAVQAGDVVRVTHHVCDVVEARQPTRRCHPEDGGSAQVIERIGEHYAVVRGIDDTTLRDGDTVEQLR